MTSSAPSTVGIPEEQPANDPALTAIDPELSAPENATDEVETEALTEAPTRVPASRAAGNDSDSGGFAHPVIALCAAC